MRSRNAPAGRVVLWVLVSSWCASAAGTLVLPEAAAGLPWAQHQEVSSPPTPAVERDEPSPGIRPPWRDPLVPEMKRYKQRRPKAYTA